MENTHDTARKIPSALVGLP